MNYLLGVESTADGISSDLVYRNMKVIEGWMVKNRASLKDLQELPKNETATASGNLRFLFVIPRFKDKGKYEVDRLPAKDVTLI